MISEQLSSGYAMEYTIHYLMLNKGLSKTKQYNFKGGLGRIF